eukprot:NODE_11_length_4524_cov_7.099386.p1 GENE.NODE_11_length_4524_cov_7.099386~~NODE_11_length_4524_cov_7.099386.p1  ORF type:complete len:1148 (-),score=202.77 NODE_11_length_4524_cov_7.099386:234-3677(-)
MCPCRNGNVSPHSFQTAFLRAAATSWTAMRGSCWRMCASGPTSYCRQQGTTRWQKRGRSCLCTSQQGLIQTASASSCGCCRAPPDKRSPQAPWRTLCAHSGRWSLGRASAVRSSSASRRHFSPICDAHCRKNGYQLACNAPWPPEQEGPLQRPRQLCHHECVFSVTAPLRRHLDVLAHRVLKWQVGWRPAYGHLRPTRAHLQEVVARTNMRHEASHFAGIIFRQLALMREVEESGRRYTNAVIGGVSFVSFDVLVPTAAKTPITLQVPISALSGATCSVEFSVEDNSLLVKCAASAELRLPPRTLAQGRIMPWGQSVVTCVVARNFAQPVAHHGAANAIVLSDLTIPARAGGDETTVMFGVGHRLYPEVFSTWPDLKMWHKIDRDLPAYGGLWHAIRLCQTHAAAVMGQQYSAHMPASLVEFFQGPKNVQRYRCAIAREDDQYIRCGDLAILRCSCPADKEAILFGLVASRARAKIQFRTRACSIKGCTGQNCPYAHGAAELNACKLRVEVELSEVSMRAWQAQGRLIESAPREAFRVQFVSVPTTDKGSLDMLHDMLKHVPMHARSPILEHLVSMHTQRQSDCVDEQRPLASAQQVQRALSDSPFGVRGLQLNEYQLAAIRTGLQRRFSVVQGPPGTGKTTLLVSMVTALLNLETDPEVDGWRPVHRRQNSQARPGKILVAAPSNQAADEVLRRLVANTTIPPRYIVRVYARSIEVLHGSLYHSCTRRDLQAEFTIPADLERHALHYKVRSSRNLERLHVRLGSGEATPEFDTLYEREEVDILRDARVVVTTCHSAVFHDACVRKPAKFATVIVDEAAQATEPDVVLPALLAHERVILVGDHMQLGPVVPENNLCRAYRHALETPVLERLDQTASSCSGHTMLEKQYRMHSSIRSFPSRQFYGARLQDEVVPVPSSALQGMRGVWPCDDERVVFVDCREPHSCGLVSPVGRGISMETTVLENNTSFKNAGEAKVVVAIYEDLRRGGCDPADIAVITPYKAQQQEIRERLADRFGERSKQTVVGTVHALQGSERGYIIVSFVRSTVEGAALLQCCTLTAATDIVVSVNAKDPALRQTCESNLGIVSNAKSLNVALTRAKHGLACVGNREVLSGGSQDFLDLSEDLEARGCMLEEQRFLALTGAPSLN